MLATIKAATVHCLRWDRPGFADHFISVLEAQPLVYEGYLWGLSQVSLNSFTFSHTTTTITPKRTNSSAGNALLLFVVIVRSALTALVLSALWPMVQSGILDLVFGLYHNQQLQYWHHSWGWCLRTSSLPFGLTTCCSHCQLYSIGGSYQVPYRCCQNNCIWTRSTLVGLGNGRNQLEENDPSQYQHFISIAHQLVSKLVKMIGSFGIFDMSIIVVAITCVDQGKKKHKGMLCSCPCNILDRCEQEPVESCVCQHIYTPLYIICSCSGCCLCNGWPVTFVFTHSVQSNCWHVLQWP